MKSHLPNFRNKVVSLTLIGQDFSHILHNPHFESQAKRLFLVGTIPPGCSRRDWVADRQGAVSWDSVQEYMVFDSLADHSERRAIYEGKKRKN